MRCLVIGGRGFIGSHLVDALLDKGYAVRCFDRPHVAPLGDSHLSNPRFELVEGDLVSEADVTEALEGCDFCFHLVSTTLPKSSNADPVFDVESNVLGTVRLLSHAVKSGVKKVVFVSSGGTVYGIPRSVPIREDHPTDPLCSYGITKLAIEKYLGLFRELHGLQCAVLRLANPFGERQRTHASQGAVAVFLGKALRGETIEIWGDGSVVRDYIHIDDVVSALLAALEKTTREHVFNIGSGRGLSLNEVLDTIERVTGQQTQRNYLPGRAFDVPVSQLCIERARAELEWEPVIHFEDGIRRFARWIEADELEGAR
ncbi:MAG TPA: NAD-dependent epimerase/dehydratase family protein [Rhodocyclaceae bacterium]|nr:NAD-dependent epimerase/dehydratase family protein [Rhodocyclaceae bacterium]HNA66801.1 NAD-dependent epimerase/dehydratase family protein [Rhodocyclaceae bacterium]HNC80075.1 NAD-dependent epimerase/dehydratase family protein [Rhodocyclaceae bacterium]HND24028.1 NAD-dependent epimerase/dehydratase family protein [Rhodocyclaceae bacterium]HNE16415.1 NAD-dependent epimerase/dehydratase family protein [Rhodocyclaceae bacterium]